MLQQFCIARLNLGIRSLRHYSSVFLSLVPLPKKCLCHLSLTNLRENVKVNTESVSVFVRDWKYEFSSARINAIFGLESADVRTQRMQIAGLMDDEVAMYLTDGKEKILKKLAVRIFSNNGKELFKFCYSNWSPTTNDGYAQPDKARLVYMVTHKMPFDFGKLVFEHMPESKFFLPVSNLVYQLLQSQHPVKFDIEKPVSRAPTQKKTTKKASTQEVHAECSIYRRPIKPTITILQAALC